MKPINLKLKGLNSYMDEQEIDFDSLCSKGLFGIFGPTGCGKSTILDGITIALYGASGMARDTKDFINTETSKAVIKYVFSLKNNDGRRTYDISRSFKNSKTGVSNDMAKLVISDESGELIEVLDKAKEVNTYLEDLLGLTAADFMRSVVLPQGKFSEFLKLKDAERRRMIERLLNLQEFGVKLADKIKKQKEGLKSRIENLDGSINALTSEDEESIEDIENEFKDLSERLNKTEHEYKEFSIYLEKIKELYKKTSELDDLRKKLSNLDEKRSYIDNLKILLIKANEASQISPIYSEFESEVSTLTRLKDRLDSINKDFLKLENDNKELFKIYDEKSKLRDEKLPNLMALEAKLSEMARLADENEANIKTRDSLRQEFKALNKSYEELEINFLDTEKIINSINTNIVELEKVKNSNQVESEQKTLSIELKTKSMSQKSEREKIIKLKNNASELELEKNTIIKSVSELEPKIDSSSKELELLVKKYDETLVDIENTRKTVHEIDKTLVTLKSDNDIYKEKLMEKEVSEDEKGKLKTEKKELDKKLIIKKKELLKLDSDLEVVTSKYEKLKVGLILNELTSKLVDGQGCPLCGSEEHPHVHQKVESDNRYVEEIESLKKKVEEEKSSIKGFEKDCEFNDSKTAILTKKIEELKEFSSSDFDVKLKEQNKLDLEFIDLNKNLANLEKDKEKYKTQVDKIQVDLEKDKEMLVDLKGKLERNKLKSSEANKNILECKSELDNIQSFIEETLSKTDFESVDELLKDIFNKEKVLAETEKELKSSRDEISSNQRKLKEMQIKKEESYKTMTSIKEKGTSLSELIKLSEEKIAQVTKEDPRKELESTKDNIKDINKSYENSKKEYEDNNEKYIKFEKEKDELTTKLKISLERRDKLDTTLNSLIEKSTFISIDEFKKAMMSSDEIKSKTQEVSVFEKEHSLLESNISKLMIDLKDESCGKEKYDEAISNDEIYKTNLTDIKKNLAIKETKLKQLEKNAAILKKILKEKNELLDRQGTINEISKLTNGNKFVEFVAINHLRYIAKDASTRLIDITNGRYSLELDYSGAFVICDNYNGGVKRSCQSLSGGETFMTSLSLALALSTHIQLKGAATLEFFILDEGFGTLDVDLLDTVMNSLEKLRAKDISVGVISHVEELKNRVPMRLSVSPAEPGLHGTKVKIESN